LSNHEAKKQSKATDNQPL